MSVRSSSNAFLQVKSRAAERHGWHAADAVPIRARAMRQPLLCLSALAAAALLGKAAPAADYATRDIGEWVVSASSDRQGCFLTRTYRGARETTLQFGLDVDGSNRLTILNPHWSIGEKEKVRLDFRLSNASFPRHLAVGIVAEGKRGFVTSFGAAFPNNFAASQFLHVRRGNVPVEELGLDGSGAAVAEMRKCVDRYRATRAEGRPAAENSGRIPVDPFAVKTERERQK